MMIRVIFLTLMSELLLFHKFYTSVISGRKEKVCFVVFLAKKKKGDFRCASYGSVFFFKAQILHRIQTHK